MSKSLQRQQNCRSPLGECNLQTLKKCLFHLIARENRSLLVYNVHEKISQKVKTDKTLKACPLFLNLHSCYNFALVLHKNALVCSQSEAHNLYIMYIITQIKNICYEYWMVKESLLF